MTVVAELVDTETEHWLERCGERGQIANMRSELHILKSQSPEDIAEDSLACTDGAETDAEAALRAWSKIAMPHQEIRAKQL